jgi:hypothetical protein
MLYNPFRTAGGLLARLAVLFSLLAAGCQAAPTPLPRSTAEIITVRAAPALLSLRELFHTCAAEQPGLGVVVLETTNGATPEPADIALQWGAGGDPLAGFTAQLGLEELVVVVHPANPLGSIPITDLQGIYQGSLRAWKEPAAEIEPWAYAASDDAQEVFDAVVLDGGSIAPRIAAIAPDPAAMLEGISGNPAAVGFLPRRWLDGRVKAITIDGLTTDRLRLPILALTNSEPEGPEKSWLLCLQEHLR